MTNAPDHDAATPVAYETAVAALPPLSRLVFLLHRVDDLSYGAIARRLSIGIPAVESGLADALYRVCCALDGHTSRPAMPEPLAEANAVLGRRYRCYCEDWLRRHGIARPILWDGSDDGDAVMQAMLLSMPAALLQMLVLSRVENLTSAQIAKRTETSRWIVRVRMLRGAHRVARCPISFERWLRDI